MTKKESTGKTFWDMISLYPKISFIIFITLIIVFVFLTIFIVNKNYTLKTPIVEFQSSNSVKTKTDTSKNVSIKTDTLPKVKILPKKDIEKPIQIKDNSSPVNVNVGGKQYVVNENKGIIGDNNVIKMDEYPPRHLESPDKKNYVLQYINNFMQQHNKDKSCPIRIRVTYDSKEASDYANEIFNLLKNNNYNVLGNVDKEIFSPPIHQTEVYFEKSPLYQDSDTIIHIKVGINKPHD